MAAGDGGPCWGPGCFRSFDERGFLVISEEVGICSRRRPHPSPPRPKVGAAGSAPGPAIRRQPVLGPGNQQRRLWYMIPSASASLEMPAPSPGREQQSLKRKGSLCAGNEHDSAQVANEGRGGQAPPSGSTPFLSPQQRPQTAPAAWDPRRAHGSRAPRHSSLQEHHRLAGCQEQPSPVDMAPRNPTK